MTIGPTQFFSPHDNPYQVPGITAVQGEMGDASSDQTANGSSIEIAERDKFSSKQILRAFLLSLSALLLHAALFVGIVAYALITTMSPAVIVAFVGLIVFFYLVFPQYEGWDPALLKEMKSRGTDSANEFVVELQMIPRLPVQGCERFDTADDVGLLTVTPGILQYTGDHIDLSLRREDVASIGTVRFLREGSAILTADMRIRLSESLLGRSDIRIGTREGALGPVKSRHARALRKALNAWFAE